MGRRIARRAKSRWGGLVLPAVLLTVVLAAGTVVGCTDPVDRSRRAPTASPRGAVVTSVADTVAEDGRCTLREALLTVSGDVVSEAQVSGECGRTEPGGTITFDLPAAERSRDGWTIRPVTALPAVTRKVTIDGGSQRGSRANRSTSPAPFDGVVTVAIDGAGAGDVAGLTFAGGSDGSEVRGLAIGGFGGAGILLDATAVRILGSRIGTDVQGTRAAANRSGVATVTRGASGARAQIGGRRPADRNVIAGNRTAGLFPSDGWVVQGNYVGLDAGGVTALPNGTDGSGGLSIDDCAGVVVGGGEVGAGNVISGNASYGLSPLNAADLTVQGNLIGTDHTGRRAVGNGSFGVIVAGDSPGLVIGGAAPAERNVVSGNRAGGVFLAGRVGGEVKGNIVGLDAAGSEPMPNALGGVVLGDTTGVLVGGRKPGEGNVIAANGQANVMVVGRAADATGNRFEGNLIGTDAAGRVSAAVAAANGGGVVLYGRAVANVIGGEEPGQGNVIAGNRGFGVATVRQVPGFPLQSVPAGNAVLANRLADTWAGDAAAPTPAPAIVHLDQLEADPLAPVLAGTTAVPPAVVRSGPPPPPRIVGVTAADDTWEVSVSIGGASTASEWLVEVYEQSTSRRGVADSYLGSFVVTGRSGRGTVAAGAIGSLAELTVTELNGPGRMPGATSSPAGPAVVTR